jgi:hypothetical protein
VNYHACIIELAQEVGPNKLRPKMAGPLGDVQRDAQSAKISGTGAIVERILIKVARIANLIFWLYMWLSQTLLPVANPDDYWSEKASQLFKLNPHLNDLAQLLGDAIFPFMLWLSLDWGLRRRARRSETGRY